MRALDEKKILKLRRAQIYPRGRPMDPGFLVERRPIMDAKTPVASIGSCFASHIKQFLVRQGYNYVQTSDAPGSQIGSAAWGTVYNTACIRQEFARADGGFSPLEGQWPDARGGFLSPYRKNIHWPDMTTANAERAAHAEATREAMKQARVFILTAGLSEIWFHREDAAVFYQVPPNGTYNADRHGFALLTVLENTENLRAAIRSLRALSPDCHVILTVSPVPLRATFRPTNVIVANAESKAILLSAVHQVEDPQNGIHYFPSYELVTVTSPNPYKPDNRHVRLAVINQAMRIFVRSFVR